MSEVIFTTIHGSHLYGMAVEASDRDTFTVVRHGRTRHRKDGDDDSVTVGLDRFLQNVNSGSHQSVEALFSPFKQWHGHEEFQPMLDGYRVTGPDVIQKYWRTITAFAHSEDFKRRRHSLRLWLNVSDLRHYGRFDPRMTESEIKWATRTALSSMTGSEIIDMLHEETR